MMSLELTCQQINKNARNQGIEEAARLGDNISIERNKSGWKTLGDQIRALKE